MRSLPENGLTSAVNATCMPVVSQGRFGSFVDNDLQLTLGVIIDS